MSLLNHSFLLVQNTNATTSVASSKYQNVIISPAGLLFKITTRFHFISADTGNVNERGLTILQTHLPPPPPEMKI